MANASGGWLLKSRLRVVLIVFGLLVLLDGARSLYARIAYSQPVKRW